MHLRQSWLGFFCCTILALGAVSCGGDSTSPFKLTLPVTLQITPTSTDLTAAGTTTFHATVGNATNTGVTWSIQEGAAGGNINATGLYTAPLSPGTYTILATSKQDSSKKAKATVTVSAAPAITAFATNHPFISPGGSAALTATFSGATATVDHGVGTLTSGVAVTVAPAATTTYNLTVSNAAGSTISKSITVTVEGTPAIAGFTATAATISAGQTDSLSFTFSGGTGSVDHGVGAVTNGVSVLVKPAATTTYTLTATNDAGVSATATVAVTVVALPGATSLTAATSTLSVGGGTTLTPTFNGGTGSIDHGVGTVVSGVPIAITPSTTTTYTLTVTNAASASATTTATVTVVPLPTISAFIAAAPTISAGSHSALTASFTGTGSVDHGVGAVTSGTAFVVSPAATTTYNLTATNAAGASTTGTATVTVIPAPAVLSFTSSIGSIYKGQNTTLTPVFSGGTGSINQGVGAVISGTALSMSPAATTTYTLTVTNAVGATDSAVVTVNVDTTPFSIASFAATPAQVDFGQSASLAWAFNGTPTALTLNGASVLGNPASLSVNPVRRQAYVLAGSNPLGGDSRIVKVAARGLDLIAGNVDGFGYIDGPVASARFGNVSGAVTDAAGDIFVADYYQHVIRKITPAGTVSTFAGSLGSYGSIDGTGPAAQFEAPNGLAMDTAGNLYVADEYAGTIRQISSAGAVSTLAGWADHSGATDATGAAAQFNRPSSVAVDPAGNVFVADTYNHTIRMVTAAGVVTTIAGQAGNPAYANGVGTAALYNYPHALTLDASGNLYVADDGNHVIRKITPSDPAHGPTTTWTSSLLAGVPGSQGYQDGPTNATFSVLWGITVDAAGNVYTTEFYSHTIRKTTPAGAVSTIAGASGIFDHADGPALAARFNEPYSLAFAPNGDLIITEWNNTDVRRLDTTATVSTVAGSSVQNIPKDGAAGIGRLNTPQGLVMAPSGDIYVADHYGNDVRRIATDGSLSLVAGSLTGYGTADGQGSDARLVYPSGITRDAAGNLYVADSYAHTIRKVSATGFVSTFAGTSGQPGYTNAQGTLAQFNGPQGMAIDAGGNLYVADQYNQVIRKIATDGTVSLYAGVPNQAGLVDGAAGTGKLNYPVGIAFDATGNLIVADSNSNAIRKVAPDGTISTITGGGVYGYYGFVDGDSATARFHNPTGVAVDATGTIYVADYSNHAIRKVSADGSSTTTIAGQVNVVGTTLGVLPASLYQPWGILLTPDGDLLVTTASGIVQITAP